MDRTPRDPDADLTSRQAADELGINVQRWHRLVDRYRLSPTHELPGIRGAKWWKPTDVRFVARCLDLHARLAGNGDGT